MKSERRHSFRLTRGDRVVIGVLLVLVGGALAAAAWLNGTRRLKGEGGPPAGQ